MTAFDNVASSDNAGRISSRIWVILEKEQNSAEKCRRRSRYSAEPATKCGEGCLRLFTAPLCSQERENLAEYEQNGAEYRQNTSRMSSRKRYFSEHYPPGPRL